MKIPSRFCSNLVVRLQVLKAMFSKYFQCGKHTTCAEYYLQLFFVVVC